MMQRNDEKRKNTWENWSENMAFLVLAVLLIVGMIVPLSLTDFEKQIMSIIIIFSLAGIADMTCILLEIFNPRIRKRMERAEREEKIIRKHFGVEEGIKGVKYRKFKLVGYIKGLENKLILFYEQKRTREKITVIQEGYRKVKS
ncbi:MAG: hypothetical protein ACTSX1_02020 [Candidatus Heimdallarchaeaceae archaeon]